MDYLDSLCLSLSNSKQLVAVVALSLVHVALGYIYVHLFMDVVFGWFQFLFPLTVLQFSILSRFGLLPVMVFNGPARTTLFKALQEMIHIYMVIISVAYPIYVGYWLCGGMFGQF